MIAVADSALFRAHLRDRSQLAENQQQEDEIRTMQLQVQAYLRRGRLRANAKRQRLEQRKLELATSTGSSRKTKRPGSPERMAKMLSES